MKMDTKTLSTQEVESTMNTNKMRMDENSQAIVFQMFTKSIYSNPIGSIVREITSNCFDSHVEAKVNTPVIIRKTFDKLANTHYISFIDFGVGISPDRMRNVFGVYFKTTKSADNEQIGGWGVGGKSVLAYRRSTGFGEGEYDNSFSIITNFDGIKYEYVVYEGAESPEYTDPIMSETTEHNGTEIRVTVLEKDINRFKSEMVRQLYYFENIIFEGFIDDAENMDSTEEILTNDYQIVRGKSFVFRGDEYNKNIHICLGKVAYPIDYNILGLSSSDYRFPVAIRLEIGDIRVNVSRESLDYNEQTIKVLKKKLEEVKAEIKDLLAKQYENIVTLEDYFKVKNEFGVLYMPNGNNFNVGDIINMKDVDFSNFKYGFLKMPNDKQLFKFFFEAKLYGQKPKKKKYNRYSGEEEGFMGSYDVLMNKNRNLYYLEGDYTAKRIKNAYLKFNHITYFIINKNFIASKSLMSEVSELFNVHDELVKTDANGVRELTPFMTSLLELQEEYFEMVRRQCPDYDAIVVPEDFIMSRKAAKSMLSKEFRNSEISVKFAGRGNDRLTLDILFKTNIQIFYGTKEDEYALRDARRLFAILFDEDMIVYGYSQYNQKFSNSKGKKAIMFLQVSQGNVKYMQYCRNAKHVSKFNQHFLHRKADAVMNYFQAQNFTDGFENINSLYRSEYFSKVSPSWGKKIESITKFIDKTKKATKGKDWSYNRSELSKLYPIADIKLTKEQEQYATIVAELKEMEELNASTLKYIDMPYRLEYADDAFWTILKKVLVY
jgi:hypothetical protein